MTLQERQNPPIADVDTPDTEVIVVAHPSPVFVDSTGRRSRLLRRVAYGFGALCMVYGGLVSVSLAGGPVSSSAVLPLPDLTDGNDEEDIVAARPSPTPEPVTTPVSRQPVLEVLPGRGLPVAQPRKARAVTPRSSATSRQVGTPAPGPTTRRPTAATPKPKPVESTTTTRPTTPVTTPVATAPTTAKPPVPPAPPAPPATPAPPVVGTGGQDGSSTGKEPRTETPAAPKPAPPAPKPAPPVASPDKRATTPDKAAASPDKRATTPDKAAASPDRPAASPDKPVTEDPEPPAAPATAAPATAPGDGNA